MLVFLVLLGGLVPLGALVFLVLLGFLVALGTLGFLVLLGFLGILGTLQKLMPTRKLTLLLPRFPCIFEQRRGQMAISRRVFVEIILVVIFCRIEVFQW